MQVFGCLTCTVIMVLRKFEKFERSLMLSSLKNTRNGYVGYRKIHTVPKSGPWKILFFGSDKFAVESLTSLHNKYRSRAVEKLEVVTVNKDPPNAVVKYAKQHEIAIHAWPLQVVPPEFHIGIVVSFGHVIPSRIISAFPLGIINVHASLLPRWRGAAPIIYSLMSGDSETGISIMKIKPKKVDIGEIVVQKKVAIEPHEMLPQLHDKLAKVGANLLGEILQDLPKLLQSARPQSNENVTYATKITSKTSSVNWMEMTARNVYDLYRALFGLYPLTTKFQDMKIKLFGIEEILEPSNAMEFQHETPGVVTFDKKNKMLVVKCKGGSWISVKKVIIPGRAPITAHDFYNGFLSGKNKTKRIFY